MSVMIPTVSQREAMQAYKFSKKARWTGKDVAEMMGWSDTKARRVIRIYDRFGPEAFGR